MRFISSPSDSGKDRAATPAPARRLKPAIATRVAHPQLRPQAVAGLAERAGTPTDPLVPTTTGTHLSRDAIEQRLARHLTTSAQTYPSLKTKHITILLRAPAVGFSPKRAACHRATPDGLSRAW